MTLFPLWKQPLLIRIIEAVNAGLLTLNVFKSGIKLS